MATSITAELAAVTFGIVVSGLVGHVAVARFSKVLWDKLSPAYRPHPWLPALLGIAERLLYTTSFLLGQPEFVAVWLALKVAGQWQRWQGADGRVIYNAFLLGNAASIGFGVVGFAVAEWIKEGRTVLAAGIPVLLVIALEVARVVIKSGASSETAAAGRPNEELKPPATPSSLVE